MGFSFNANTLAFGGLIQEGGNTRLLPSQASVTLPQDGGFGESSVCNYNCDGISFYRAESRIYGSTYKNRLFKTFANVTVYGLDIEGRIQADVLSASIISINERVNSHPGESRIAFDANIVGLVIDDQPYSVDLDTKPFHRHGTFSAFTNSFGTMTLPELTATANAYDWALSDCITGAQFHVPARCQNALRATIATKIAPALTNDPPKHRQQGFTVEVPGIGLLHLGEVMLTVGKRGINLLRVEVGKTLEDLVIKTVQEDAPAELLDDGPRPLAFAAGTLSDGGYTIAHATGNGTDFGPPP